MYQLYGAYGSASFPAHTILEIVGEHYEFIEISIAGEKTPEHKKLHPQGKIPILVKQVPNEKDMVMFEASAISTYLADLAPGHRLSPRLTDFERGHYLQWMAFLSTGLQEQFYNWFYPDRYTTDSSAVDAAKASAELRIDASFATIDGLIGEKTYLVGHGLTACDLYLLMLVSWSKDGEALFQRCGNIRRNVEAVTKHPVVGRVFASYDK